ncbi:DUF3310 domain-containing protein [Propionivibrio dicarboxylicus]|uniref:Protein of unknwon function n=1 Tax=Propionivibrio dicarboxylicus TaxID=83767 RepID=A0A1G8C9C2_9RHOO|nr:DUF3310 domain-containing protein [Propionivibrio dicarboxylicus]SDH41480.1 Protein of unknwon function [Propionivibrio dicarboxylicus]
MFDDVAAAVASDLMPSKPECFGTFNPFVTVQQHRGCDKCAHKTAVSGGCPRASGVAIAAFGFGEIPEKFKTMAPPPQDKSLTAVESKGLVFVEPPCFGKRLGAATPDCDTCPYLDECDGASAEAAGFKRIVEPAECANDRQVGGDHYKKMGIEPWDVVDTWPIEQRIGYYRGGALKYLMRMGSKDESEQEIRKGNHYLEKLLEVLRGDRR